MARSQTLIWIMNAPDPANVSSDYLNIRRMTLEEYQAHIRRYIIGEPKATDECSVEKLKEYGYIGLHLPKDKRDEFKEFGQ